jgi:predicted DNA-binding mobile mystery protein A
MSSRSDIQWLTLRQTETQLESWKSPGRVEPPASGWIAAIRMALGMSRVQLAERLGVTRSSVVKLEEREVDGGVTLDALRKAADALGCTVSYALVPKNGSLEQLVVDRANLVASVLADRAVHTMSLEDQSNENEETRNQRSVVARRLLAEWPRDLWDLTWDQRSSGSRPGDA